MRDFFHASSETDVGAHRLLYYSAKNDSCKNMCVCYGLFWKRITGKEMLGIAPAKVAHPEGSPKVGGQNP